MQQPGTHSKTTLKIKKPQRSIPILSDLNQQQSPVQKINQSNTTIVNDNNPKMSSFPTTNVQVLSNYDYLLTDYEKKEIKQFEVVYFLRKKPNDAKG